MLAGAAFGYARGAEPTHTERVAVGDAVFELRYEAADRDVARQVKRALHRAVPIAERWGRLTAPVVLTIHPTHEALEAAVGREGHGWLRAWARRESLDLQSPRTWDARGTTDDAMAQLLAHELTHCVMYQSMDSEGATADRGIPRWFAEGMASVTAGQRHEDASSRSSGRYTVEAPAGNRPSTTESTYRSRAEAVYATAHRAFRFLIDRHGEESIRRLLAIMRDGERFPQAFEKAIGLGVRDFEDAFHRHAPSQARER
jgi:hypothetical protein